MARTKISIALGTMAGAIVALSACSGPSGQIADVQESAIVQDFAEAVSTTPPVTRVVNTKTSFSEVTRIELSCEDDVACDFIAYRLEGPSNTPLAYAFGNRVGLRVGEGGSGVYALYYRARDTQGNWEQEQMVTFRVDLDRPLTQVSLASGTYHTPLTVELHCSDVGDGCDGIAYSLDGSTPSFLGSVLPSSGSSVTVGPGSGTYTLKFRSRDKQGNLEEVRTVEYQIALPCEAGRISSTGYEPCPYRCGTGKFENTKVADGRQSCGCILGYQWDSKLHACVMGLALKTLILMD